MLELLPDGSYTSIVVRPAIHGKARNKLIAAARAGEHLGPGQATRVRVIEYEIHDRDGSGELIALITTITDPADATARELALAYCQRWEEETGNDQLKTCLRGPGKVLRSKSPDMVRQEIYRIDAHRITHLGPDLPGRHRGCIDRDRVTFVRTVRHHPPPGRGPGHTTRTGRSSYSPPSWPTSPARRNLKALRPHGSCPRVVRRARHNS